MSKGLIVAGGVLCVGIGEYLFLTLDETDWQSKANCAWLENRIADYKRYGEQFREHPPTYAYYSGMIERCEEELKIQHDWITNAGFLKKWPAPIPRLHVHRLWPAL